MRFKADSTFLDPSVIADPPQPHPWMTAPANALAGDRERIIDLAGTQVFRDITLRGTRRWLRLSLLSQPVMEACLKVPTWMWIAGGENRAIADISSRDTSFMRIFFLCATENWVRNQPEWST